MEQKLTLFELNQWIRNSLKDVFPSPLWVVAEISELKENRSGHCYVELVEKEFDKILARARGTIWSYTYRMLKPYFETTTGQLFTQGIKILVQVSVEFHPTYGLSLNIKDIDPAYTMGELALQRKEIIERLQNEGVFDMNKDLVLPIVPQKIAVISSRTAAGYQDFMEQLEMNAYGIRFYTHLFEAFMQGSESVSSIIRALERIFHYEDFFDAVAVIRGGGATADLSSFDNYDLAFYVTQFPIPVITGIGHEKDDTIIDLVAHTRMKTPTAVAEFFINGAGRFYEHVTDLQEQVINRVREHVELKHQKLERLAGGVHRHVTHFIYEKKNQLSREGNKFQQAVSRFSFNKKHELNTFQYGLQTAFSVWQRKKNEETRHLRRTLENRTKKFLYREDIECHGKKEKLKNEVFHFLAKENERIKLNMNAIRLLDPKNVLLRGYTLTMKNGNIVKSVKQLSVDNEMETLFTNGKVTSIITKKG